MIKATFKQKQGSIYWYKVEGHAFHAPSGTDIVCAGVSSLYIAITNELRAFGRTFERDGGYFVLDGGVKEQVCLDVLKSGLSDIADQYPENVTVEVIE